LLLMDTSELAIFHGLEMSRKAWAYQLCRGAYATAGEIQLHTVFVRPAIHDLTGKLTPVIHLDEGRQGFV
ncbi:hypothetical protein KW404_21625, partial [Xanthomonas vasicola pv. vasculorum]